jgi:hypothetical protein
MRVRRHTDRRTLRRYAPLVLFVLLAACRAAGGASVVSTPSPQLSLTSRPSPVAVDCPALLDKTPQDAAATLTTAGYEVSWRAVHTMADGTAVADVVKAVPAGKIIDIILDGASATIFVANQQDPVAKSPEPATC